MFGKLEIPQTPSTPSPDDLTGPEATRKRRSVRRAVTVVARTATNNLMTLQSERNDLQALVAPPPNSVYRHH